MSSAMGVFILILIIATVPIFWIMVLPNLPAWVTGEQQLLLTLIFAIIWIFSLLGIGVKGLTDR